MSPELYHVSEEPDIPVFEPRPIESGGESLVWAIDDEHLRNYLVPRVAVVAIESGWFERVRACRLFRYHLSSDTFECRDRTAGYFVSRAAATPRHVDVDNPVAAILRGEVELRVLPDPWSLRNAVIESTQEFSIIRWRNASPERAAMVP